MQVWLWWIIFTDCCWVHGLQDNLFRESQNIPCMCRAFEIHYFYQQKSPAAANAYWLYTVLTAAQCRHELEFSKYDTCTTPTHLRSFFLSPVNCLGLLSGLNPLTHSSAPIKIPMRFDRIEGSVLPITWRASANQPQIIFCVKNPRSGHLVWPISQSTTTEWKTGRLQTKPSKWAVVYVNWWW